MVCTAAVQAAESDSVTLQLRWQHQFQFAGYYAALEKGYYRDAGLDVRIQEAKAGESALETVLEGKAQYGVGTSELLLERQRGAPVVVLGVIFQHSPLALVARRGEGIANIHSLAGQRVMIEPGAAELLAYLRREGIDPDSLKIQEHGQTVDDLLAGRLDAMSVYITDELYELRQKRVDTLLFRPDAGGLDFYGDNLFTTQAELDAHPERVRAFRAASLKGWAYAMDHPQEIIDLILARYSKRHSREHLFFEAEQMAPLIQPHMVEIGYMHPGRWQHILGTYAELGLVPSNMKLDGFLYSTGQHPVLPVWLWPALGAAFVLGLAVAGVVLAILSYRRRLAALESRSLALLEEAPIPVAVVQKGGEGRILYLNRCSEEHFKVQRADVIGKTTEYFWSTPEKRAEMLDRLEREGGRVVGAEVQILDLARRPLWLLMSVASVEFAREAAYLVSFHDITRRKHMEAALRESEARFRAVAENAYDVIWTMDANGRFTYVSPSVERLRGYTPEEVMAQDMAHALTPDSLAKAADGMAHLLRTGELLKRHWELEQPCKDGSTVWTDLILSPMKDEGGRLTGLLGITRDVTAERQLRQDLLTRGVAIEAAAEGIVITDRDGIIEY
ncbi:MAG: ABC transporter substrate-binding protein, partial [Betaproteobacteria bacterium]|nr:ABC transporter substrate-binding protein [Betaproteobacteria bacterium]